MKKLPCFAMLVAVIGLFVLGCEKATNPVEGPLSGQSGMNNLAKEGPVFQSVTGSGHFTTSGDFRTFSFTARRYADGSVDGEWQRHNRGLNERGHGKVTCMTIIENQAWLGGFAQSGVLGEVGWRIVDNGEGGNAPPDQISVQFAGMEPGFAENYCFTRPDAPTLHDIEAGNIQVRSGNLQVDQVNDVEPENYSGCGTPPSGGLFQSFTPTASCVTAVDLRLRTGGDFPVPDGFYTTINIRHGTVDGIVLGTATAFVPDLQDAAVRFDFSPSYPSVTPGDLYIIEWITPGNTILTWAYDGDTYSGGTAFGCTGNEIPTRDFIFTIYTFE